MLGALHRQELSELPLQPYIPHTFIRSLLLLIVTLLAEDRDHFQVFIMAQELYQYKERIGPGAFRLILLQPCSDLSAPLQVQLITTTLHEYDNSILDHYTALSYVWGDASHKSTAFIDGQKLEITASLDSALRHIRDLKGELKIWADGICINQTDFEERNIQVQQMGLIYQLARHMIIFLGESTPASIALLHALTPPDCSFSLKPGLGLLSNISCLFNARSDKRRRYSSISDDFGDNDAADSTDSDTSSRFALSEEDGAAYFRNSDTPPRFALSEDVQAFAEKIIRQWPWFTRIWVLQELVLSLDPWVQIGRQRIRWNVFSDRLLPANVKEY
jgi:hypothetical protein